MSKFIAALWRGRFKGLLALFVALCLMFVTTLSVLADTVHIYDQAKVLDQGQVQSEASTLPYPIDIYTSNNFTGTTSDFDQRTRSHITNSRLIVIAIDTVHHHLAIVGGSDVPLTNSQYVDAVNAFKSNYSSTGYTGATVSAIRSLRSSLSSAPAGAGNNGSGQSGSGPPSQPSSGASGNGTGLFASGLGTFLCIGLLILAGIVIFGVIMTRRRFMGPRPINPMSPINNPYQQPYGPYNQGYPPNYYGPGYPQGSGMNPWVAGGLGAAGGGFLGYELGKEAGEREAQQQGVDNGGNWTGGSGDFGGGGGGDFGGGASGDFGGGGGDFGGGGSGNF